MKEFLHTDRLCMEILQSIRTIDIRIDEIKILSNHAPEGIEKRTSLIDRLRRLETTRSELLSSLDEAIQNDKWCTMRRIMKQ